MGVWFKDTCYRQIFLCKTLHSSSVTRCFQTVSWLYAPGMKSWMLSARATECNLPKTSRVKLNLQMHPNSLKLDTQSLVWISFNVFRRRNSTGGIIWELMYRVHDVTHRDRDTDTTQGFSLSSPSVMIPPLTRRSEVNLPALIPWIPLTLYRLLWPGQTRVWCLSPLFVFPSAFLRWPC